MNNYDLYDNNINKCNVKKENGINKVNKIKNKNK
jgi:hypothetical protein